MNKLRYTLVIGAVVAVALVIVHQRRDSIARDIANRMLEDSGVVVVDVDVDDLGPSRVVFDHVELRLADGAVVNIDGIEVPLTFPSLEPEYVALRRIRITPAPGAGQPAPLTPVLRSVLGLPGRMAGTAVTVDRLDYPGLPVVSGIVWNVARDLQRLYAAVGTFRVTAETGRAGGSSHRGSVTVAEGNGDTALSLNAAISDDGEQIFVDASGSVAVGTWQPSLRAAGVLPAVVDTVDGSLQAMLGLRLDQGTPGNVTATVRLATDSPLALRTNIAGGTGFVGHVPISRPAEVAVSLPARTWSLEVPEMLVTSDYPGAGKLPLRVSGLRCDNELRCRLAVDAGPGPLSIGNLSIERAAVTLPLAVTFSAQANAVVSHDPTVLLTGLAMDEARIGSVSVLGLDGGRVEFGAGTPTATADRLSVNVSNIEASGAVVDALALNLVDLQATAGDRTTFEASFSTPAGSGTAAWRGWSTRLPQSRGHMELAGGELAANASIGAARAGIEARAALRHRLASGEGSLQVQGGRMDFGVQGIAQRISGLPAGFDVIAGTATFESRIHWPSPGDAAAVSQSFAIGLDGLAARYDDIAATGIGGILRGSVEPEGVRLGPSTLRAALIDAGVQLENFELEYSLEANGVLAVDELGFGLLGGRVTTENFHYDPDAEVNAVTLQPQGIQLPFMAELAGFESIDVEGSLSGAIPVRIHDRQIIIEGGRLENDPPGGVIRYDTATAGLAGQPNVELATRALENFRFDSLTSAMEYDEDGDLTFDMRLSGINPDMDPNQPIILNLSVENNIPELLQSLKAVRSIEDVFERRTGTQ